VACNAKSGTESSPNAAIQIVVVCHFTHVVIVGSDLIKLRTKSVGMGPNKEIGTGFESPSKSLSNGVFTCEIGKKTMEICSK
jgi:hypothetical protein